MMTLNRNFLFLFFRMVFLYGSIIALLFGIASCGTTKKEDSANELPIISSSTDLATATSGAAGKMLVLDLYADWCRPCKILAPTLVTLASDYKSKAAFYRVNIDNSPDLARSFGVQGIPYVIFMKNGSAVYALTGLHPVEDYRKVLDLCDGIGSADKCTEVLNDKM